MKNGMGVFKLTITAEDENNFDSECHGLVVQHALSAGPITLGQRILGSGAMHTPHMQQGDNSR